MKGEEVSMNLPEELVVKILAMLPFPYVLKARALSKSWLARFSSIACQEDELKKSLAASFQQQVGEWSASWTTFCPVFISIGKEEFLTYDRASCIWLRIPFTSFFPEVLRARFRLPKLQTAGGLFLVSTNPEARDNLLHAARDGTRLRQIGVSHKSTVEPITLYVANLFTRSWMQLPPPSSVQLDVNRFRLDTELVTHKSSGTYTVIMFYIDAGNGNCLAQIYDSKYGAWRSNRHYVCEALEARSHSSYFDGRVYRVISNLEIAPGLLAFCVEEGTFTEIAMPPIDIGMEAMDLRWVDLVVCDEDLLMVVYDNFCAVEGVVVLKIDLVSRRWLEVTRGPPPHLNFGVLKKHPASDGDCIFFQSAIFVGDMLAYNLHEDEWSCFPCPTVVSQSPRAPSPPPEYKLIVSSFRPGLNPFVGV